MKRTATLIAALLLATPLAARSEEPQKLTIDTSGWLILNTYANSGALNANDLPRYAKAGPSDEEALGMGVRQSRLRLNIGIPTDELLLNAKLKALVELDFMGGNAVGSDDPSLPLVRLRHAWVSAAWPRLEPVGARRSELGHRRRPVLRTEPLAPGYAALRRGRASSTGARRSFASRATSVRRSASPTRWARSRRSIAPASARRDAPTRRMAFRVQSVSARAP